MAAPYKKVQIQKYPLPPGKTDESRYWKRFKTSQTYKEVASVTSIHFSPIHQHDFAVTASTRIQIYSSINGVKKTISRFKDVVYSGHIRNDGKLLVAGDATGLIQIFDLSSRAILRTIRKHQ
ncbi:9216_t:CDS:2, partial [Paraglomus brasilianum]